jgi:DNA-binding NarL/FixJ family response regulator
MLEEIVSHFLESQRDMEVAGTARKQGGLPRKVARTRPDVVLLGMDDPPLAAALLEESPRLKVLSVDEESRDSWLYRLNPERTSLGSLTPDGLVRIVRRAVGPGVARGWWSP